MRIKALKTFNHDQLGRVYKNETVDDVTPQQLSGIRHLVEVYDTKVIHPEPAEPKKPDSGTASSSQAAQASETKTVRKSRRGPKRKTEA